MQRNLNDLKDMELLTLLRELDNLSASATNITIGWVRIPKLSFDDIASKALELRGDDRITKPIFVINLKKDIKNILADRYIEQLSIMQQDSISIAV